MVNPTDLLEGLTKIYSPSQQERGAVDYLVAQMGASGMNAFVDDAGNAVGILGNGAHEIVMLGHIDTFHGYIDVRQEEGRLYGRGVVDAKGCLATFVSACARVGSRHGLRFIIIGAVEEESTTSKGARFAMTKYSPDCCIIGEPSGWDRITLGYKGRILVDYECIKPMTHTASAARSAAEESIAFWNQVAQYALEFNHNTTRLFDRLDVSLRAINTCDDGFTDRASMRIGLRVPIGLEIDALEQQISRFSDGAQIKFSSEEPPFRADKNNRLVRAFLAAIRKAGGEPAFTLKTGTADMNVVGPVWNCPIVAYGPGDSSLDHTPNEYIDLKEYSRAIDVLEHVLLSI